MSAFDVVPAHQLPVQPPEHRWLIQDLWATGGVGIIGGEPKTCKSFLALGMGVAVASGQPCLGCFPVPHPGRVLLYAAEDALHVVRDRLEGIADHHGLDLTELDVWVITATTVRLDAEDHRHQLVDTVATLEPALLILDPFVRLHRVDENVSSAVAPLLAFLRQLQRTHGCAVALVHHTRKNPGSARAGQTLRGSSELHAWGDSNLYIRRRKNGLSLSIEHRAHPSVPDLALALYSDDSSMALVVLDEPESPNPPSGDPDPPPPRERILEALRQLGRPTHLRDLRRRCRIRNATICQVLNELEAEGCVERTKDGWMVARTAPQSHPFQDPSEPPPGEQRAIPLPTPPRETAGTGTRNRSS